MNQRNPAVEEYAELGRALLSLGWVPALRFLLRHAEVLHMLEGAAIGPVLEVGTDAGSLRADLAARGFSGVAIETSVAARATATQILADYPAVQVTDMLPSTTTNFAYLVAFEVLKHLAEDCEALAEWVQRLALGGRTPVSDPAYANRWTATDTWEGHVRRCRHYGYHLADIMEPVSARVYVRALSRRLSRDERRPQSGVLRTAKTRRSPVLRRWPDRLAPHVAIRQRWFADGVHSNGLLLEAERVR